MPYISPKVARPAAAPSSYQPLSLSAPAPAPASSHPPPAGPPPAATGTPAPPTVAAPAPQPSPSFAPLVELTSQLAATSLNAEPIPSSLGVTPALPALTPSYSSSATSSSGSSSFTLWTMDDVRRSAASTPAGDMEGAMDIDAPMLSPEAVEAVAAYSRSVYDFTMRMYLSAQARAGRKNKAYTFTLPP